MDIEKPLQKQERFLSSRRLETRGHFILYREREMRAVDTFDTSHYFRKESTRQPLIIRDLSHFKSFFMCTVFKM